MSEIKHPVSNAFAAQANINASQYKEMYQQSVDDPETFWAEQAKEYVDAIKARYENL
mgnify:CR=1 FL=1